MKLTRDFNQSLLIILFLTLSCPFPALGLERVLAETDIGLYITIFQVPQGRIKVYLPDDMALGDTISGTTIEEPAGKTEEELRRSLDELDRYFVGIEKEKTAVNRKVLNWTIPGFLNRGLAYLTLRDKSGKEVARAQVPVRNKAFTIERSIIHSPWEYECPNMGRAGRPTQITGPFDGSFSNTEVKIGGQEARLLAESPRKLVVESPEEIMGLTDIELKEGDVVVKRRFNNLRVTKINEEMTPNLPHTKQPTKIEAKEQEVKEKNLLVEQTLPTETQKKAESETTNVKEERIPPSPSIERPTKVETYKEEATKKESLYEQTLTPLKPSEKKAQLVPAKSKGQISTSSPIHTEEPTKVEINKEKTVKNELSVEPSPISSPINQAAEKLESKKAGVEKQIPVASPNIIKKLEAKKEEKPMEKIAATLPSIKTEGKYTVQVASFKTDIEAQKFAEELKSKGYPGFVKTVTIPGKGTVHRVRIGTFKTRKEAKLYGDNLKKTEPQVKSVIVTVND
jgi:cell division septation protein DedD